MVMAEKPPASVSQSVLLEQYLILAKAAKGIAAVGLIKQVLEAPGIYVFGELLDMPNIKELATGESASYFHLLNVFAYGTFTNYLENKTKFPELTQAMITKLRHLTIVSLATKSKCIPYSTLLKELDLHNLRELEDLIIEVIYADIVRGKLDQKNNQLEIDYTIGRDIQTDDVNTVVSILQEWCTSCETILSNIESQITKANSLKDFNMKQKQQIETEVNNIKKNLKDQSQDSEEQMATDSRESVTDKAGKKPSKTKGLRGSSGKFWQKSS
ncbi:COP9 signalosome subunit 7 isoform X2 [Tachypleus tridentatus]|uniref:COP9 signalosome subunit 7 isoform X2 n=1 Tax=Tachypleus tridentatus TaxID=6853 RepID=UPI003FD03ABA